MMYESPEVEELGTVSELTAGPFGGKLDNIVGGDGGFNPFKPRPGETPTS